MEQRKLANKEKDVVETKTGKDLPSLLQPYLVSI